MNTKKITINLSGLRLSLSSLTRKIFAKKIMLIVTSNNKPCFTMAAIVNELDGVEMTSTRFRTHTSEILDLLENDDVFITDHGHRRVVCKRIEDR